MENATSPSTSAQQTGTPVRLSMGATISVSAFVVAVCLTAGANPTLAATSSIEAFFNDASALSAADLESQRGGFRLANGARINFGVEIQQLVNNTLQNEVQISSHAQNHFTVTQNQNGQTTTTNLSQLPNNGIVAQTQANNGLTNLAVTVSNGSLQSLVQNAANNTSVQVATTVNIDTQGLSGILHAGMTGVQLSQLLQANQFIHH